MRINVLNIYDIVKQSFYTRFHRLRFNLACRGILKTKPISPKPDGILIISIVSHRDFIMYLIAAKSFYFHFKRGSFVLINDGSLTEKDFSLIRNHIVGIEIVHADDINKENTKCPKGGTWERLLYAADYNQDNYCIILDADTVTQHKISVVEDCVNRNVPFVIPGGPDDHLKSMKHIWEERYPKLKGQDFSNKWDFQGQFDVNLNRIIGFEHLNYIRGSSGFHGQSKGYFSRERLEKFSQDMESLFGQNWNGWSSEQSTVCVLVANTTGATELPYSEYALYWGDDSIDYLKCSFVHFISPCRFKNSFYIKAARSFIEKCR